MHFSFPITFFFFQLLQKKTRNETGSLSMLQYFVRVLCLFLERELGKPSNSDLNSIWLKHCCFSEYVSAC